MVRVLVNGHHPGDEDHQELTTADIEMCVNILLLFYPPERGNELEADGGEGDVLEDGLVDLYNLAQGV